MARAPRPSSTCQSGYASYKVADSVTSHDSRGMGIYSVFNNPVTLENAVEMPNNPAVKGQHLITVFLGGTRGASINHIVNGLGNTVNSGTMTAKTSF